MHLCAYMLTTMNTNMRNKAAKECLDQLDTEFFRAFCDRSRMDVIAVLIKLGRSDISEISAQLPLDRSVVSRHLKTLEQVGIANSYKEGRQVFYELDGPAIMEKLKNTIAVVDPLVPLCCPSK